VLNKLITVSLVVLLSGCNATIPPAFQQDREPEDRDEYNGLEGLSQQQKDQNYLMVKELSDKCSQAQVNLIVAKTDKNKSEIIKQKKLISSTCLEK